MAPQMQPCLALRSRLSRLLAVLPAVGIVGTTLLAAASALAQTCGPLGSPSSLGGCVVPGQYGSPSVRIKSDPLNPGGFRFYPVTPSPSYPTNLPGGLNRNYSQPGIY